MILKSLWKVNTLNEHKQNPVYLPGEVLLQKKVITGYCFYKMSIHWQIVSKPQIKTLISLRQHNEVMDYHFDHKKVTFLTRHRKVCLVWTNKRSGLLSKSVGTAAGYHNLRPLSNHTNCAFSLLLSDSLFISSHQGACTILARVSTHFYAMGWFYISSGVWACNSLLLCACTCLKKCLQSYTHNPFVLSGGLVHWLVPALPFRQVLLPCT